MEQFKMVCFHASFSQNLQYLMKQKTSHMHLFRDHLMKTNNICLSNNVRLEKSQREKCTILHHFENFYVHTYWEKFWKTYTASVSTGYALANVPAG